MERGSSVAQTAAARRMRESRDRQRLGLQCIIVEIRAAETEILVAAGLLGPNDKTNRAAIAAAFGMLLDRVPLSRIVDMLPKQS